MHDPSIYASNLAALKKAQPELAALLAEPAADSASVSEWPTVVEAGRRGLPTLKVEDKNGAFYLNSLYDPPAESQRLVQEEIKDKEYNVVVHIGLALGYTLEALAQTVEETATIVMVEPDLEAFRLALQVRDLSACFTQKNIVWSVADTAEVAVAKIMGELNLLKLTGWISLITAPVHRLHKEFIDALIYKLSSGVTGQRLSKATELIASELFLTNSFENLPFALGAPGVLHLYQSWNNKPAVIVSAGPSLEKQLDLLRAHQDKILLIAVGAAWKSLRAADIEPHMVVTVDPFPDNYPHFEGLEAKREWLITDFACNTDVVRTFNGKKIFCHSTPTKEALFRAIYGEWGILLTGGSVANSAMSLAITMGASPVILVGQDLAYTGGISHATGHTGKHSLAEAIEKNPADFREVPGYGDADPVLTNTQMEAYRLWFENIITTLEPERVINATEGGAKIAGALEKPFAEMLAQYAPHEIDVDALWPAEHSNKVASINKINDNLRGLSKKISKLQMLSTAAGKVMTQLIERAKTSENCTKLEIEYNKLARKISVQDRIADFFLTAFVQNEIFLTQRRLNLMKDEKANKYQTNLMLHMSLPKACERAVRFLNHVMAKLKAHSNSAAELDS
jgi:hypothetical protein